MTTSPAGRGLLATKLFVPPRQASLIARPRVLTRLQHGSRGKLTLIAAPAGSGKTSLLADWLHQPAAPPVAWVSLDEGDNDPQRFWSYVIAALDRAFPGIAGAVSPILGAPQAASGEEIASEIINALVSYSPAQPVVLVLDDYHLVGNPATQRALAHLVEHLPSQLRLVIASRVDPPLPLARLRARGDLAELRAADLRFTAEEAGAFLREKMGLSVTDRQVAALEARTEGWIAGLQLAALSLHEQADVDDFIRAFAGSNRHVVDYLVEEVFSQQPRHVQTFLLQTAILDRLCGPLCDTVLGLTSDHRAPTTGQRELSAPVVGRRSSAVDSYSQLVLDQLERANLFLIPLDAERQWYRYHHLLADVLRHRLQREQGERLGELHRRAAEWLAGHALLDEAIDHALAAGDAAYAAQLIVRSRPLVALARAEATTVQRRIDALPAEVIRQHPALSLARARLLLRWRRDDAVEEWLREAEQGLTRLEASGAAAEGDAPATIRGEIATTRAFIENSAGRVREAAEMCRVALSHLPAEDTFGRAALHFMLGNSLEDPEEAIQSFAQASALGRASGNMRAAVMSLVQWGLLDEMRAELPGAAVRFREALEQARGAGGCPLPIAQAAYRLLGGLLYEWNELEESWQQLEHAREIAQQREQVLPLARTLSAQALVLQARGEGAAALAAVREAREVARSHNLAEYQLLAAAREAVLSLRQGDVAAAGRWAAAFDLSAAPVFSSHDGSNGDQALQLDYARVRIAQGRPDEALAALGAALAVAREHRRPGREIEALALHSLAQAVCREREAALASMAQALTLGAIGGYMRLFLDEGEPMRALLAAALGDRDVRSRLGPAATAHAERLRAAFEGTGASEKPGVPGARGERPHLDVRQMEEPLTPRELEVLRLLAAGMSSSEIAGHFVVSINTVKTQLKSIYGKLDAHSRSEALARARGLGLL